MFHVSIIPDSMWFCMQDFETGNNQTEWTYNIYLWLKCKGLTLFHLMIHVFSKKLTSRSYFIIPFYILVISLLTVQCRSLQLDNLISISQSKEIKFYTRMCGRVLFVACSRIGSSLPTQLPFVCGQVRWTWRQ